jgi:hypothetical protein
MRMEGLPVAGVLFGAGRRVNPKATASVPQLAELRRRKNHLFAHQKGTRRSASRKITSAEKFRPAPKFRPEP